MSESDATSTKVLYRHAHMLAHCGMQRYDSTETATDLSGFVLPENRMALLLVRLVHELPRLPQS